MPRALRRTAALLAALALALAAAASTAAASTTVGGFVVGTSGYYDYSPTVLQSGSVQDFWWCGDYAGHITDTLFHQQYSLAPSPHVTVAGHPVLSEGAAGAWDSVYVCNPTVVRGSFVDPLGDGATYTWALYYVGTSTPGGTDNSIGAAFSADGDHWVKASAPVIADLPSGGVYYGLGQPNAYDPLGGSAVTLLYEDTGAAGVSHLAATSTDGVHFTTTGTVTTAGLPAPTPTWGGAAYDPADGRWYAAFNDDPTRPPATTGGVAERGQPGVTLYATADLLGGPWTPLDTIDTAATGYESNFLAALLRDPTGALYGPLLPSVELYASTSNPRPAYSATHAQLGQSGAFNTWDVAWSLWTPGNPLRPLVRAVHAGGWHETTTGWYDAAYYHPEAAVLGALYEAPAGDATVPLYLCKAFSQDYLVTADPACRGQYRAGLLGYAYPSPGPGRIALYECWVTATGDFVSADPGCESQHVGGLLGYSQG